MKRFIRLNAADNVAVALADGAATGDIFVDGGRAVRLVSPICRGHKFALSDIRCGEPVIKYGFPIGHATRDIAPGEWVHTHNLATSLGDNLTYAYHPRTLPHMPQPKCPVINGYLRYNGEMGIRNELWIIPTVGCVNSQAQAIAGRLRSECDMTGVDGVQVLSHSYGCSQLGDDHANTRKALASLALHPNAGGVLVIGLGCENNQLSGLREQMGSWDPDRVRFLISQDVDDEVEAGVALCRQLIERMRHDRRQPLPMSKLRVGLKCGGSDGLSGITANPLVGRLSDRVVACGGTTVLTEVPEMFGAETILMDRAADRSVFEKTVSLINDFKEYFRSYGQPVYENPSPGNKAGGITTLEEKSLGCVQKGGTVPVTDVLQYTARLSVAGLNLLAAPGNDLVAATALAISGCQIVLFTTGRGTPFGTCVPTMKISTNSQLAARKPRWIDFDAGVLVESADMDTLVEELLDKVLRVCDGERLCHEHTGSGQIAIFKTGVTL